MSIGANIRRLRKERDITQEQLAELLHVTSSAISQWETGRVMPDVVYLPKLAYLFQVSADVILGIDVDLKEKKIQEIYDKAHKCDVVGEREQAIALCREGLDEFPDAYSLMEKLADCLLYVASSGEKELLEAISLFETILSDSNDELRKNYAIGNLCTLYTRAGRAEEARKLAESMPEMTFSRDECLLSVLQGAEWAEALRYQIVDGFDRLVWKMRNLAETGGSEMSFYTAEEGVELWRKIMSFVEVFYEKDDYGFDEYLLADGCFSQAALYAGMEESEKAIAALEKMSAHIEKYDAYYNKRICAARDAVSEQNGDASLLTRRIGSGQPDQQSLYATAESSASKFLKKLSDKRLDSVRDMPGFQEVEKRLRNLQ